MPNARWISFRAVPCNPPSKRNTSFFFLVWRDFLSSLHNSHITLLDTPSTKGSWTLFLHPPPPPPFFHPLFLLIFLFLLFRKVVPCCVLVQTPLDLFYMVNLLSVIFFSPFSLIARNSKRVLPKQVVDRLVDFSASGFFLPFLFSFCPRPNAEGLLCFPFPVFRNVLPLIFRGMAFRRSETSFSDPLHQKCPPPSILGRGYCPLLSSPPSPMTDLIFLVLPQRFAGSLTCRFPPPPHFTPVAFFSNWSRPPLKRGNPITRLSTSTSLFGSSTVSFSPLPCSLLSFYYMKFFHSQSLVSVGRHKFLPARLKA